MQSLFRLFSWTPGSAFVNTTNLIGVQVTDNGLPPMADSKSFAVAVLARPLIESAVLSNGLITVIWSAIPGQAYQLQFKTNLADATWNDLLPGVTASGPTAAKTDAIGADPQRFYRVQVTP